MMNNDYIIYVAGFLFSEDGNNVVLIKKNKPEYLKGLYNPVGGKVDKDENPDKAIIREFIEETGVEILNWEKYCILQHQDKYCVHFYTAKSSLYNQVKTIEEEVVGVYNVKEVYGMETLLNVKWLLPMALDKVFANIKII